MQSPLLTFLALAGNAVMIVASLAFWWVERGSNANVTHYADALWWAFATVSTVGYGDVVPVTAAGRGIAIVLGAALATIILGITTEEVLKKDESLSREETATILREIASLRQEIEKLRRP
jgi:voltage-gated potassium channel